MKVKQTPISEIRPYPGNPRKITSEAIAAVTTSIREFGFRQPIVVDDAGVIIVGHTRFAAAQRLNMETVPVHVAANMTEQQVRAYRIADNATGERSEWDFDMLKIDVDEIIAKSEVHVETLGFSAEVLAKLDGNPEDAAETGEAIIGEYEQAEGLTLVNLCGKKIPINEEEEASMQERIDKYVELRGTLYGFFGELIDVR